MPDTSQHTTSVSSGRVCILLNGPIQVTPFSFESGDIKIKSFPETSEFDSVFLADGGVRHYLENDIWGQKLFWFGDFDSSLPEQRVLFETKMVRRGSRVVEEKYGIDKDFSDYAGLLDYLSKQLESDGQGVIVDVLGGLGGRKDHEAANLYETFDFVATQPHACVFYFHSGLICTNQSVTLPLPKGKIFSVMSLSKNVPVSITGAQFHGDLTLTRASHGLSNRAIASSVTVAPKGVPVFIYF